MGVERRASPPESSSSITCWSLLRAGGGIKMRREIAALDEMGMDAAVRDGRVQEPPGLSPPSSPAGLLRHSIPFPCRAVRIAPD